MEEREYIGMKKSERYHKKLILTHTSFLVDSGKVFIYLFSLKD